MINIPFNNKLGLGRVSIYANDLFFLSKFHNFALQMLVVGPLFQITAFLIQFLALPFPIFALSFSISGIGTVFQVGIVYIHKDLQIASDNVLFRFVLGCVCEWLHRHSSKRL